MELLAHRRDSWSASAVMAAVAVAVYIPSQQCIMLVCMCSHQLLLLSLYIADDEMKCLLICINSLFGVGLSENDEMNEMFTHMHYRVLGVGSLRIQDPVERDLSHTGSCSSGQAAGRSDF